MRTDPTLSRTAPILGLLFVMIAPASGTINKNRGIHSNEKSTRTTSWMGGESLMMSSKIKKKPYDWIRNIIDEPNMPRIIGDTFVVTDVL